MSLFRRLRSVQIINDRFLAIAFLTVSLFFSGSHSASAEVIDTNAVLYPRKAPVPTTMEAKATTVISMIGNLNADSTTRIFDIDNLNTTTAFSTGFQIFDSFGSEHDLTMYFTRVASNTWQWNLIGHAAEYTVVSAETSTDGLSERIATGTLGFTTRGLLDTESSVTYYNAATPTVLPSPMVLRLHFLLHSLLTLGRVSQLRVGLGLTVCFNKVGTQYS